MRKLKKDQLSTCFPTSSTLLFTTHFVTIWVNLFVVFGFVDFLLFFLKVGPCHGQWVVKTTMSWWTWFPGMSELWILANQSQGRVTADQLQAGKLASRSCLYCPAWWSQTYMRNVWPPVEISSFGWVTQMHGMRGSGLMLILHTFPCHLRVRFDESSS